MPNRILREGILTSERVARLGWPDEVFYRRLMSVVDDFGRYHANPKLLRAALYPLLIDKVSDADIGKWLTSCVTAALVSVYPASDGKRYLQLSDFRQQTRAASSKYPQPPSECLSVAQQMLSIGAADAHLYGDGDGDGDGVVSGDDKQPTVAPARPSADPPPLVLVGTPKPEGPPDCPHLEILALWGEVLPALPQHLPEQWKGARADHLRARWRETAIQKRWVEKGQGIAYLRRLFEFIGKSAFLTGRVSMQGKRPFVIELEWLVNPTNWAKVIEGKYHEEMTA